MESTEDTRHPFGDLVRDHRLRRGLSQEELATETGIATRSIRNIEAGRVGHPRTTTVRLLAEAFGLAGGEREAFTAAALMASTAKPGPSAPPGSAAPSPLGVEATGVPAVEVTAPAQLPRDVAAFAGRTGSIDRLWALLAQGGDRVTAIPVISGAAGVGKTTLAVHWAHQVADRFPDGQLYVNLHGFGPGDAVVTPDEALADFLVALGVPRHSVPAAVTGRTALYRSHLAGKRVLVVLDNARDADQVRPLLPGTGGCLTIVTSREQLTSLVATDGATPVPLGVLDDREARELLEPRIGAARLSAEPAAVSDIISRCDRLPLALAIVAARAAVQPDARLADMADELRHPAAALDALDGGDAVTEVRTVFSWSYRSLPAPAARLFQSMGLHPGPDLDLYAAANMTGLSLPETRRAMAQLVRSHLATARPGQRYAMHDLLRAYAAEVAHAELAEDGCRAVVRRLLAFYQHTVVVQLRGLLLPAYDKDLPSEEPAVAMQIADDDVGGEWVEAERVNLVATVVDAGRHGLSDYAPTMALCLWNHLSNRGYSDDCLALSTAAVAGARATGDPLTEAAALNDLAGSLMTLGRYAETIQHGERALQLSRTGGIAPDDEARMLYNLVEVYLTVGDMQAARRRGEEALRVSRLSTDPFTEADVSLRLALLHRDTGSLDEALAYATAAVQVYEPSQYVRDKGEAFIILGTVYLRLEAYDQARHYLLRSQELFRSAGQYGGALGWTLDHLGTLSRRVGERQAAARYLTESLDLARVINDPGLQADALTELGLLAHEQGRTGEGVRHVQDALALSTETGHRRTQAPAHNALGEMLLATADVPGARRHFSAALEVSTALEDPYEQARARAGLRHRHQACDGAA